MSSPQCYSGKIIYLNIGDDYADGFIAGGESVQFVYFLCKKVYDEGWVQMSKGSALKRLQLRLPVYFQATVVNRKRGFYVANLVWLKSKPRNVESTPKIYSEERAIDLYRQCEVFLGTPKKDIQKNSYIIWNSLFGLFGAPQASQARHLRGKTATVWRAINEDEGLLALEGRDGQTDFFVWFNRSHLEFTSFDEVDTFENLLNETFHFDADLIWEAANGDSWYEVRAMWEPCNLKPVGVDETMGTSLSDWRSESVFTEQLKLGQTMVRANVSAVIVDRFFWTLSKLELITQNPKVEVSEESETSNESESGSEYDAPSNFSANHNLISL